MKKIILLIAFAILGISSVSADYESLDKFNFNESEYTKIVKEKILTNGKIDKTFPKYKGVGKKIDKLIYNKLGTIGMQTRRDYLKKVYASVYTKYNQVDNNSSYSSSKKNLAKLVYKYIMLESYVMYYRNK